MYIFKPKKNDKDINSRNYVPNQNNMASLKKVEFIDVVKSTDGFDKKKYREIKRSTVQLSLRKPRNMFMIFRSLIKCFILDKFPSVSFTDVSKISSLMWANRNKNLEKYVKYLAEQDDIYRDCAEVIQSKPKNKKMKRKRILYEDDKNDETENDNNKRCKKNKFVPYKIKNKKDNLTSSNNNKQDRIEDIYMK